MHENIFENGVHVLLIWHMQLKINKNENCGNEKPEQCDNLKRLTMVEGAAHN